MSKFLLEKSISDSCLCCFLNSCLLVLDFPVSIFFSLRQPTVKVALEDTWTLCGTQGKAFFCVCIAKSATR